MDTTLLHPGDRIMVRGAWGAEPIVPATVLRLGMEAGRPVVECLDDDGNERWAYDYQVEPDEAAATPLEIAGLALIVLGGFIGIYVLLALWTGGF